MSHTSRARQKGHAPKRTLNIPWPVLLFSPFIIALLIVNYCAPDAETTSQNKRAETVSLSSQNQQAPTLAVTPQGKGQFDSGSLTELGETGAVDRSPVKCVVANKPQLSLVRQRVRAASPIKHERNLVQGQAFEFGHGGNEFQTADWDRGIDREVSR